MLITTKQQYMALARSGLAGNCLHTWDSPEAFLEESDAPLVTIRSYSAQSSRHGALIKRGELLETIEGLCLIPGRYYLSESISPENVVLQGELTWMEGRWVFRCTGDTAPMREAFHRESRHVYGLYVWALLRWHSTDADIEDLHSLFDDYSEPGSYPVIELTVTKGRDFGIFPHRKIVVWEIRHY